MPTKNLITICIITIVSLFTMVMKDYILDPEHRGYFFNLAMAWAAVASLFALKAVYMEDLDILNHKVIILSGIWLLFFPNSAYLIVDPVLHVEDFLDLVTYIPSVILGIMVVIYSLNEVDKILETNFNETTSSAILAAILYITSFGVYLGLVGRWNSWDLFTQPVALLGWSASNLLNALPFSLLGTTVLAILYFFGKKILNPSLY